MEVDFPTAVPAQDVATAKGSDGPLQTTGDIPEPLQGSAVNATAPKPARTLRARASLPQAGPSSTSSPATSRTGVRHLTDRDLELINKRLGPEGLTTRRDDLVREKEGKLRELVDDHDTAVKQKFHLERYVSILEGFDPVLVKQDDSPVFLDYKRQNHNLMDLLPRQLASAVAGPSRPRASIPSRTTRRQVHEQSEIFAPPPITPSSSLSTVPPSASKSSNSKGKEEAEVSATLSRSKGKGRAAEEPPTPGSSRKRPSITNETIEMPPPPVPNRKGKGRRATLGASAEEGHDTPSDGMDIVGKGKKRARASMPNLVDEKRPRGRPKAVATEVEQSSSPAMDSPAPEPENEPEPTPTPAPLPSLAHLPFEPPPAQRIWQRPYPVKKMWYTDPNQLPPPAKHSGDISSIMNSYIQLEDTGPQPDLKALELRAAHEAYLRNRAQYLLNQGRLTRLLEEEEEAVTGRSKQKAIVPPPRQTDHQDSLIAHMVQVRNAMLSEAKSKPIVCKRIARMIMAHWDHELNKEERERVAEEKEQKRKVKEIVRALRKRWGLAVKVIRAKIVEAQKAEQDRLGKEHLQNMLQRSTGLLEAQRDDIMGLEGEESEEGEEGEEGEQGDEEEDLDSDGTEEVSAAEDSDGDEGDDIGDDEQEPRSEGAEVDDRPDEESEVAVGSTALSEDTDLPIGPDEAVEPRLEGDDVDSESEESEEGDLRLLLRETSDGPEYVDEAHPAHINGRAVPGFAEVVDAQNGDEIIDMTVIHPSQPALVPVETSEVEASMSDPPFGDHTDHISPPDGTDSSLPVVQNLAAPASALSDVDMGDASSLLVNGRSSPSRNPRSKRSRKSRSVSHLIKTEDPDANDVEFEDATYDLSDQDHELDVEMEDDESAEANSEDEGLLADADLPIEDLLKKYGYTMPTANGHVNGDLKEVETDKSLLDSSLAASATSPPLVVEGKRNRRVRSVWTPEDNPPPPPKRAKIEVVEELESTPELSSSDDEDGDDDEDVAEPEDPNKVRPPFLLRGTLRPYQQAGLEWLASLYANKMNGILADEMGLGKTIQTISLLGHLACDKGVWGKHLVIVPTSVILNWEMEFKKFLPGMKVLTYYGNQKERKEKRVGWNSENTWQVCITSYQIVLADQHIFRKKNWVYMILDEAHNIKNFRSQRWQTLLGFKAQRRLLLTGTPLQNNLMELWSLLYFLMPNGVTADATAVVGFANHKEFSEWFSNPMDKAVELGDVMDEETLETISKLHTLLRPFILRRLKSEVETQLPGKFEHVVYCKLSKRQRFLYDEFMSRASTKEALTSGGYLGVVNTLMQLRKVCNHPDLFEVRPVRTSFAMDRSVLADFEPSELLVRKRLLAEQDTADLDSLKLIVTNRDDQSAWVARSRQRLDASGLLPHAVEVQRKGRQPPPPKIDTRTVEGWLKYREYAEEQASIARWRALRDTNRLRCSSEPVYGSTFLDMVTGLPQRLRPHSLGARSKSQMIDSFLPPVSPLIQSYPDRARSMASLIDYYAMMPPNVVARDLPQYALPGLAPSSHPAFLEPDFDTLHRSTVKLQIAFPDASLLQYDCGKLSKLDEMLRDLKAGGHRVLIFTQMTRVLDILEMFLSYNGHRYLRLDGSTKIEDRQIITERFNSDSRIFCFIASSRSGGVGINLTGADTVFFYDSDWNPSMDRQCMDRAHRIGQTREVHIYRFVSSHTVEENMLKKANQKRLLDRVVIQEGDFTTDFFGKMDWRDLIDAPDAGAERVEDIDVEGSPQAEDPDATAPRVGEERELARALAEVEDEEDVAAAKVAQNEGELDFAEFGEAQALKKTAARDVVSQAQEQRATPGEGSATPQLEGEIEEEEEDDGVGAVDEYMLRLVEWDWDWFCTW